MTEFEQKILTELADLRKVVESLKSDYSVSQITYFENLPIDAVVGVDYVAFKWGISQDAVIKGRFETNTIPRFRSKPLAFIKRNVDAVFNALNRPVSEVAAQYRHKTKNQKKRGKNNE